MWPPTPVKPIRHVHALDSWVGLAPQGEVNVRVKRSGWDRKKVHFQFSFVWPYIGSVKPGDISTAAADRKDGFFDKRGESAKIIGSQSSRKHVRKTGLKQPHKWFYYWMRVPNVACTVWGRLGSVAPDLAETIVAIADMDNIIARKNLSGLDHVEQRPERKV